MDDAGGEGRGVNERLAGTRLAGLSMETSSARRAGEKLEMGAGECSGVFVYSEGALIGDPGVLASSIAERIPARCPATPTSTSSSCEAAREKFADAGGVIGNMSENCFTLEGGLVIVAYRMSAPRATPCFWPREFLPAVDIVRGRAGGVPAGRAEVGNTAEPIGVKAYGVSGNVCIAAEVEFGSSCRNP